IVAELEFSQPVHVKGLPALELEIDGTVVEMLCSTPNNTETDTVEFENLVMADDHGEATEVEFGDIVLHGSASLRGGFAGSAARLSDFASDLATVKINAAPTVATVALTGDDSSPYVTGDTIQVTVTMSKPVTVDGTPFITLTMDSGTKEAAF